jgi:hypothetical protein
LGQGEQNRSCGLKMGQRLILDFWIGKRSAN